MRKSPASRTTRKQQRARLRKLRYVSDAEPGITRRRAGKGFVYRKASGTRIKDAATLARIRALAIPPAYADVWICADRRGHLQATGRDARGRKQYRYHPDWRDWRAGRKYRRLSRFGQKLPALRAQVRRDLAREGMPRDKVLAIMARVMMATRMRVGSAAYARDNHSYGLSTLRARHVDIRRDGEVAINFRGKGGVRHEVVLQDKRLASLLRRCTKMPGAALFQYDDDGASRALSARQFNDYLRDAMGERFSAKDYRTWAGTVSVIASLARTPLPARGGERARRMAINRAVAVAAERLGNTPAICRKAYVCPHVLDGWRSGDLQRAVPAAIAAHPRQLERRAVRFLQRCFAATG